MKLNLNILNQRVYLSFFAILPFTALQAANGVEAQIGVDLVSSYIWRGQKLGSISVQPTLGVAYKQLSLTAWGSTGFQEKDAQEIDLTLAYQAEGFNIGVTDYWIANSHSYFHYDAHATDHVFEGNVGYDFGMLAFSWNTNFAGADYFKKGGSKRAYSSYFQLSAPFKLGTLDWNAEIGATPWEGAYADEFAIVNVGIGASKEISINSHYTIPVVAKLIANPSTEAFYLVFGLCF